jgi:hypothetical protein
MALPLAQSPSPILYKVNDVRDILLTIVAPQAFQSLCLVDCLPCGSSSRRILVKAKNS